MADTLMRSGEMVLAWASVLFAVLWIAAMWFWSAPLDPLPVALLVVCGALAGVLWFLAMRWWTQRRSPLGPRR